MSRVPGRLHATGGVLFILCGIAHTIGQFTSSPLDDAGRALEQTMKTYRIADTPFTYWNIMQCWGVLYGAMTLLFGVLLLVTVGASGGDARVRKAAALTGVVAAIAQTASVLVFHTPPPAFFMIPAALLLVLAAVWRDQPVT